MKRLRFSIWITVLTAALVFSSCQKDDGNVTERLVDLGIPLSEQYSDEKKALTISRRSEDMAVYGDRVYVGGGDYDANTGPVNVWCYDTQACEWICSAEMLEDEQIKRFVILDGTLCATGTDPRGDWSQGNYYALENGQWQTYRVLPSGIHCFDAVEFDGKTFFGLGVPGGDYPVAVSSEDGFASVPFARDGTPVDTSYAEFVRVYNLTVFQDQLFAFLTLGNADDLRFEVYRYDGDAFTYLTTPPSIFFRGYDMGHTGEFEELAVFINGYCYFTASDMTDFRPVRVGDSDLACDMEQIGDALYVLAYRQVGEQFESGVYVTHDGYSFEKLFFFRHEIPANSFAYHDGCFYFSMGRYYDADSSEVGRVYRLPFSLQ